MSTTELTREDQPSQVERPNPFVRVYRGETKFDFVGRRRWWYLLSGIIIVAGLASFGVKGFNWGIDFKGGTSWEIPAHGATVSQVQTAVSNAGVPGATVQGLGQGSSATVQVQADLTKESSGAQVQKKAAVTAALAKIADVSPNDVSLTDVGPTWGSQITDKALIAVLVFFVVVVTYISFRFEWKMAMAALIAVVHDLLVTAGIYSLFGFQVTPDTVIALLTILGYSLYDTVVVFDRVKENSRGQFSTGRMTYTDIVNLSMNQTLARSINTSLVAILPVLAVLVIGAQLLGATTLQYFGLALVIGLTSGAYSSIFIASPVLAGLKEREPRYINIRRKLENRPEGERLLTPRQAAVLSQAGSPGGARASSTAGRDAAARRQTGVLRPGAATRRPAPVDDDAEFDEDEDETEAQPAPRARSGSSRSGGATRSNPSGGGTRSAASSPRRPPPRPRKGKGSKKGGKRR
ncbi:MAG: protein translocase subunit SecF [Acidimicrobiales bacterium]|jgi:preprotein translocase subunit SecF